MNANQIVISKKQILSITIVLGVLIALFLLGGGRSLFGFSYSQNTEGIELAAGSPEKFAYLSGQGEKRSVGST